MNSLTIVNPVACFSFPFSIFFVAPQIGATPAVHAPEEITGLSNAIDLQ
jgi:hypothetical protein